MFLPRAIVLGVVFAVACLPVSAQPKTLSLAWEYATPKTFPQAMLVDSMGRPLLFAALKNGGLAILDLADPQAAPKKVAVIGTNQLGGMDVMHLTQHQGHLLLALGDFFNVSGSHAGLAVVNVANPRAPRVSSIWKSAEKLQGAAAVIAWDKHAYLGAMNHGVFVFDVGDLTKIKKIADFLPEVDFPRKKPTKIQHPNARGFALRGPHLYVANDAGGLRVLDVGKPAKPREIGRYINARMGTKQQAYNNIVLDGNIAYAAVDYAGLEILDIRDPAKIKQVAWWNPWEAHTLKNLWFNSPGHTNQIEIDRKRRLVYLSAGDSELLVVDVSDPSRPKLAAQYGTPKDKLGVWGLTVAKDHVYLGYITAGVPFHGTWAGIKAVRR